ncbi:hypothetical protein M0811_14303 [Anaeramoeba ignava]|uniref:USP domain-containing protein n=1 Tax=Anaeramoeba ignava TaxID=1746090 RepID=A0A9Q0LYX3_ANAIG|nr:hypothetical protein M0811_14303 [Anaeramoeba ignava]
MKTEKETVPYSYLVSLQNDLKGLKNKKIFYGACGHWSETETEFYSLNIFLYPPVANTPIHLLDLIDSYFSLIHPDKDNLMICEEYGSTGKKSWPVVIPDKIDLQKYGEENWIPHNIQDISTPPCILSNQSSPLNEVDERIESIETNQSNNLKEKDLLNENNQSLYSSPLVFSSKSSQSNQIDEKKDLLNETNKSINKDDKEYSLRGAILHLGISLKEGHYIALWRNKENGKWYVFDDSKVFFVRNPIKYLTNNASILLYEKMKNSNQNKSEYSSPNLKKVENNSVLKKTEDEKTSKVDMRMLSQDNIQNLINQLKDQKI